MPPETETPPVDDAQETGPQGIHAALAAARETLAEGGSLLGADDEPEETPAEPEVDEPEDEPDDEPEVDDDEPDDEEYEEDDEPEEEVEEGEASGDEEVGEEEEPEEPAETFSASIPGRGPDDDDIEIEVSDAATRDRINQLRNGYMSGEQFRAGLAELQGAQEELYEIEEQFGVDPAGFVLKHIDKKMSPQVALALLVEPEIWKHLEPVVSKLVDDPAELRTLQAEAKAARLETKEALQDARTARRSQNENAARLNTAIDQMVPTDLSESRRGRLIQDMTRDVVDHIKRNNLETLDPKDLIPVLADRLESNGIDPLDAREAVKNGKRSKAKPSTRKKKKGPKKTGKKIAKASAKRRKVAAAPGAGRRAAPTEPKKLPANQTIAERLKEVRKRGLGSILGN